MNPDNRNILNVASPGPEVGLSTVYFNVTSQTYPAVYMSIIPHDFLANKTTCTNFNVKGDP
ncbi:unnamed protein product [Acanthoscelides obtectus]|uniref:Uncharacterized protein n=1 Tax=Acanthoscelides obtectus TaxID=200917 RepID=A0A9P0JRM5_ACAOB|nr:unnamed protein product [Acanthoscelides obtectus]CAK1668500.1 hypothetical protein AOBTE_LOCUS26440 [Acanthoscelides obtectus]